MHLQSPSRYRRSNSLQPHGMRRVLRRQLAQDRQQIPWPASGVEAKTVATALPRCSRGWGVTGVVGQISIAVEADFRMNLSRAPVQAHLTVRGDLGGRQRYIPGPHHEEVDGIQHGVDRRRSGSAPVPISRQIPVREQPRVQLVFGRRLSPSRQNLHRFRWRPRAVWVWMDRQGRFALVGFRPRHPFESHDRDRSPGIVSRVVTTCVKYRLNSANRYHFHPPDRGRNPGVVTRAVWSRISCLDPARPCKRICSDRRNPVRPHISSLIVCDSIGRNQSCSTRRIAPRTVYRAWHLRTSVRDDRPASALHVRHRGHGIRAAPNARRWP